MVESNLHLFSAFGRFIFMNKEQLRELRERYDLTQGELAEVLQVAPNTISRWEIGEREIPIYFDEDSINPIMSARGIFGSRKDLDRQIADLSKDCWEASGKRYAIPIEVKSDFDTPNFVYYGQTIIRRKLGIYKSDKEKK